MARVSTSEYYDKVAELTDEYLRKVSVHEVLGVLMLIIKQIEQDSDPEEEA